MKNLYKAFLMLGLASSVALTGCIEEVEPTNGVTQEQLNSSVKAGEATLYGMAANMVEYSGFLDRHISFSYPAMMHIRDLQLDEMVCASKGINYNQWSFYEQARYNSDYWMPQYIWVYYSSQILAANKALQTYPEDIESDEGKGARAVALTYRALALLDAARWFEFLPNDKTSSINNDGNDVLNLTIPVVTETMTEEEARNNPRKTHDEMVAFLLKDLKYAEENIEKSILKDMIFPDLSVVYGLYARVYMWDEDYTNAATYARKAIETSGKTPLTEAEWTDPKRGFNDATSNNSWMWCMSLNDETSAVQTGICNFTSFMSLEATYGYAGVGAFPAVGVSFYNRVNRNDFRKLSWLPKTSGTGLVLVSKIQLNQYSTTTEKKRFCDANTYAPIKFRPYGGNCTEYSEGSIGDIPLMRVEEMHFIEIEAAAHANAADGKSKLETFMNTYRMSGGKYTCSASSQEDIIEEINFQKRVEFWGEGLNFFDYKRLGYKVTRAYAGTNYYDDAKFNTEGRPAWFNMPFVDYEPENNVGVLGWNNPNCDGLYPALKDIK